MNWFNNSQHGIETKCVNAWTFDPEPQPENERRRRHTKNKCDCDRMGLDKYIFW